MAEINSIDKTRQDEDSSLPSICQSRFLGSLYNRGQGFAGAVWDKNYISPTLTTMQGGGREPMIITCKLDKMPDEKRNRFFEKAVETAEKGNAKPGDIIDAFNGRVIKDGISPTITTRPEGKKTAILPCVKVKQATKKGYIEVQEGGCYDASYPDSKTRRGRVQEGGDVTPTITAQGGENINYVETVYRIRKLTPKECWRLMGYTDEDYEKASRVNSNTQLYKQAGNAIVKQVLMAIFSQLNIKGVKAWNDMTETEKRDIIKKTTMAGE